MLPQEVWSQIRQRITQRLLMTLKAKQIIKDPVEVDIPYSQNISTVLDEQMSLKQMRDSCDSSYDDMHMTANEQIADMEKISNHLNEQYEKYSDYDKLENAKIKWMSS